MHPLSGPQVYFLLVVVEKSLTRVQVLSPALSNGSPYGVVKMKKLYETLRCKQGAVQENYAWLLGLSSQCPRVDMRGHLHGHSPFASHL